MLIDVEEDADASGGVIATERKAGADHQLDRRQICTKMGSGVGPQWSQGEVVDAREGAKK